MKIYGTRNEIIFLPISRQVSIGLKAEKTHFASLRACRAFGYTLIEVIIVVTIIAIFAGVFMFFSGDFVSRARLDVSADTVLAAFSDSQEKVKNGVRVSSDDPVAKCFGLKLDASGVFRVFAPYSAVLSVPCDVSRYSVFEEILLDEHVYLRDFTIDATAFDPPLVILYEPPHGEMRVFEDKDGSWNLVDKNVSFLVSYGTEGDLFKKIVIDSSVGRARFSL